MSLLFYENQLRFQPDTESNNEKKSANISANSGDLTSSELTQQTPASFDLSSYSRKLNKSPLSPPTLTPHSNKTTSPKVPSNLVKSETESASDANTNVLAYEKDQLVRFVSEKEKILCTARSEYDQQYANFFKLTRKFQAEKLNNLKLTFKNQMLKQKIYFETEIAEISKECQRDYENSFLTTSKSKSKSQSKLDKEKMLLRAFKQDMRKLLDYMRDALVNSGDTLIEAYEACQVLKSLEKIENNMQKQHVNMKHSTSNLLNAESSNANQASWVMKIYELKSVRFKELQMFPRQNGYS